MVGSKEARGYQKKTNRRGRTISIRQRTPTPAAYNSPGSPVHGYSIPSHLSVLRVHNPVRREAARNNNHLSGSLCFPFPKNDHS